MPETASQHTVLQVIPGLDTGGAEKTTLDIGEALVAKGWISLVASSGGQMVNQLEAGGSQHFMIPLASKNPLIILRNAVRLAKLIKNQKVNIIHARSRAPAWSALIAARLTGVRFITTYHGAYSQQNFLKAWYNSVMARADVVIANSQWTADLVTSRNPTAKDKIIVVHRGTDFEKFKLSAISKERLQNLRDAWGVGSKDKIVLQLARLTGWKGQSVMIDAAAKLKADYPNLKFVLAGDAQGRDNYLQQLNSQIKEHNLQETVILPGHCDDPAAAMALANVVAVASTDAEAFGRAAVEAQALERPVVVTRIGAVAETVLAQPDVSANKRTGWKVPPNDSVLMAKALGNILSLKKSEHQAVGTRARAYCEAHFSLEKMCNQTLSIYDQVLNS